MSHKTRGINDASYQTNVPQFRGLRWTFAICYSFLSLRGFFCLFLFVCFFVFGFFFSSLRPWFFLELCMPRQVPTNAVISFLCHVGAVFHGESCPL